MGTETDTKTANNEIKCGKCGIYDSLYMTKDYIMEECIKCKKITRFHWRSFWKRLKELLTSS